MRDISHICCLVSLREKVRHPEEFVGATDVIIVEEGEGFVRREMTAMGQRMKERITWDEQAGVVDFAFENDPLKTGSVKNIITEGEDGQLLLTFVFDMKFTDVAPQAMIDGFRANVGKNSVGAVAKTIKLIEARKP